MNFKVNGQYPWRLLFKGTIFLMIWRHDSDSTITHKSIKVSLKWEPIYMQAVLNKVRISARSSGADVVGSWKFAFYFLYWLYVPQVLSKTGKKKKGKERKRKKKGTTEKKLQAGGISSRTLRTRKLRFSPLNYLRNH